jgi:ornithine cyclodeaminase/alanine dehydrogenase-like protein (mu-crystallin family)
MKALVVSEAEVRNLLPMDQCMDAMAEALAALSRGEVLMPLRSIVWLPDRVGGLATMPAALPTSEVMGVKAISVFPGNRGTRFDSHQGVVLLFETQHGRLQAIMDATSITAIRTAAVSGVGTRALARDDARDLAILGSGTQAWTHLEAMLLARPVERVRIWSRSAENGRRFAERAASRFGIHMEVVETAREAVLGADLVCTVTSSLVPVLEGSWLSPGVHVNAVGAVGPTVRELDTEAVARSRFFVDRRESAVNEAGEFVLAREEGAIGDDHILGELGEVLLGDVTGRASPDDVTVFRSLGVAVEDLASARIIYRRAVESGAGTWIELGGERED